MISEYYQKTLKRDDTLAKHFKSEDLAVVWISSITKKIAPWIYKQKDKSLWELVRFVSIERFIACKNKKLPRKIFAQMVFTFCREALNEEETASKIQTSMEHYKYNTQLSEGCVPEDAELLINIINGYFDGKNEGMTQEIQVPTLASRLEDYIRGIVYDSKDYPPFEQVRVNPAYGKDITPNLAIEKYQNIKFFEQNRPSSIVAYKCIDCELDKKTLNDYYVTYKEHKNLVKLYIVGQYHLRRDVYQRAEEIGVGYVYINPTSEMTQNSYELPRTINDSFIQHSYMDMILGNTSMQHPLIVCDCYKFTTSLADSLLSQKVIVKKDFVLKSPRLTFAYIEAKADKLTRSLVDELTDKLQQFYAAINGQLYSKYSKLESKRKDGHLFAEYLFTKVWKDFSIDPFLLVEKEGLNIEYINLPDNQLGRINLIDGKVMLSKDGFSNNQRLRFTLAHEYGHYLLHKPLLQEHNIQSFGDNDNSLDEMMNILDDDRKWLERQANHFASCLLMPSKLVGYLFTVMHKEFVENKFGDTIGPIYYNENQPETYYTYNNVVGSMAELLNVSKQAMQLRLKHLKLLKTS